MKVYSLATRKNVAALLIGPLSVLPTCVILGILWLCILGSGERLTQVVSASLFIGFVGLPIAYLVTLTYGLPVAMLLAKFNKLNFLNLALLSIIPAAIFCILAMNPPYLFLMYGLISILVAASCWWIHRAVRWLPNRLIKTVLKIYSHPRNDQN